MVVYLVRLSSDSLCSRAYWERERERERERESDVEGGGIEPHTYVRTEVAVMRTHSVCLCV